MKVIYFSQILNWWIKNTGINDIESGNLWISRYGAYATNDKFLRDAVNKMHEEREFIGPCYIRENRVKFTNKEDYLYWYLKIA